MLQDVLLPVYRISTRPGSPRRSSGWRCRPWRSRRWRRPRYSQYFSVDDFVDCRITQQVRTVFKQSALVGFSSKIFLGRLLLNFDELELKNFYQTFDKRWLNFDQTFIKLLIILDWLSAMQSSSLLAPAAPFFAFVYKHLKLVENRFLHEFPSRRSYTSLGFLGSITFAFYFIPSVIGYSANTGGPQAWNSCSCTVSLTPRCLELYF